MNYIKITALDTLFFRDGKPFTMKDDSVGVSLFPPAPSVFRGFLRSVFLNENPGYIKKINTKDDVSNNAHICFFAFYDEAAKELLYPLPADLFVLNDDNNKTHFLELNKKNFASSYSLPELLHTPAQQKNIKLKESFGKLFITQSKLVEYINGVNPGISLEISDYITEEAKVGIGRDNNTHTTQNTGLLYQILMKRPENKDGKKLSFVLGFNNLTIKYEAFLSRLGGEGKVSKYEPFVHSLPDKPIIKGNMAKMLLLTPAVFSEGWYPKELFKASNIELVACVTGRYSCYGGWDIKKGQPKPTFKAVPAGSVYYLKASDNATLQTFINTFHFTCLKHEVSVPAETEKEGFGLVCFADIHN